MDKNTRSTEKDIQTAQNEQQTVESLMERYRQLAERDPLTGIYNRRFFMKQTAAMLRRLQNTTFVMIRMDIDQFRLYNDSFGSQAGDELIGRLATLIKEDLKLYPEEEGKSYGRIDADIFGICIPYHKEVLEQRLLQFADRIRELIWSYTLKVSFGLYVIENPELEMEKIYSNAAEAARICKHNMNRYFAYYQSEMSQREAKAQAYTNGMKRAMEENQFLAYFQPKYSIESNTPCGAEALIRWNHPEWGMVAPNEFIPVFEQNGLIVQLDYYMWDLVCSLMSQWRAGGLPDMPISVNISRISLYNPKLPDTLVELTTRYEIPRYLLNLEITESAYMSNPDLMKETITRLRDLGFVIMMDDFGSGYSSLNTLKDIDVDILKIDMKFLPTGQNNAKSEKILASITRMAGWLGMPVVVEGVETREQRDFLESIGCHYIQGYYYAKPMPAAEYEKLIRDQEELLISSKTADKQNALRDFELIWSSDSRVSTLLTSVSVPFLIFEYSAGTINILRMNQAYLAVFDGLGPERFLLAQEETKVQTVIEDVVAEQKNQECECLFIMPDGSNRWYQIRLNYIGALENVDLLGATFCEVTSERKLEKELNSIFKALSPGEGSKGALLVIDDQEVSRQIIRSVFEEEYMIMEAEDGRKGLELLQKSSGNIAAILLDMMMPNMNGQEFLSYKNRMSEASDIPVMVISADSNEAVQVQMLKNGVNDYVTKPFIPAILKRRLDNVLEYNSRFRNLVQEYRSSSFHGFGRRSGLNLTNYTIWDLRELIMLMNEIFDLVRLVDPVSTSVVSVQPDGSISRVPYSCFRIWGRQVRCENCSSICALEGHRGMNKFELLKQDVFYVVSQPIRVRLDQEEEELVLEAASLAVDSRKDTESPLVSGGRQDFYHFIQDIHMKIYKDPLTDAYNRRFLDELLFLHHGQNRVAESLAIVIFDVYRFKQINDIFGHQVGDQVLKELSRAVRQELTEGDSLIRYGGDEFVLVLTDCKEKDLPEKIRLFKKAVRTVKYGPNHTIFVDADFGCSFTTAFEHNLSFLENMIQEADRHMYREKRRHSKQGG